MNDPDTETKIAGPAGTSRVSEEAFFFELGEDRLFAFLHCPAGTTKQGIVFCHALAEEKLWSHRVYVNFSRAMAAAGYCVLRFDMRGEGDSDLEFAQTNVESRIQDTLRALDVLIERISSLKDVTLVGHRLGGSIACRAAMRSKDKVRALVVWDPILDGEDYFQQLLRSNLATQMATQGKVTRTREALIGDLGQGESITVDGYELTQAFYRELAQLTAGNTFGSLEQPCLVLSQKKDDSLLAELEVANPRIRRTTAAEPPFWRETRRFHQRAPVFTRATLEWMKGLQP